MRSDEKKVRAFLSTIRLGSTTAIVFNTKKNTICVGRNENEKPDWLAVQYKQILKPGKYWEPIRLPVSMANKLIHLAKKRVALNAEISAECTRLLDQYLKTESLTEKSSRSAT